MNICRDENIRGKRKDWIWVSSRAEKFRSIAVVRTSFALAKSYRKPTRTSTKAENEQKIIVPRRHSDGAIGITKLNDGWFIATVEKYASLVEDGKEMCMNVNSLSRNLNRDKKVPERLQCSQIIHRNIKSWWGDDFGHKFMSNAQNIRFRKINWVYCTYKTSLQCYQIQSSPCSSR